jgi:anti-sigma factor RsiW
MKRVDPSELSALLDGELTAQRAAEVRRAIADDPALRREYEELAQLDDDLRAHAQEAVFEPRVEIPQRQRGLRPHVVWLAPLLVIMSLALRMLPLPIETGVEVAVVVILVPYVLRRLLLDSEQERRALANGITASPR